MEKSWNYVFELLWEPCLFLNQNICCGYSKELSLSQSNGSFEKTKRMFKLMVRKY